jgi:hypothetical protein
VDDTPPSRIWYALVVAAVGVGLAWLWKPESPLLPLLPVEADPIPLPVGLSIRSGGQQEFLALLVQLAPIRPMILVAPTELQVPLVKGLVFKTSPENLGKLKETARRIPRVMVLAYGVEEGRLRAFLPVGIPGILVA